MVLLTNESEERLENPPAVGFRLKTPDGSNAAEMIVFAPPLNLMPADVTLPVYAYFPPRLYLKTFRSKLWIAGCRPCREMNVMLL